MVGVELDEAKGKNNGSAKGVSYFKCQPDHGIFVPPSRVTCLEESECPACGASVPFGAGLCSVCGMRIEAKVYRAPPPAAQAASTHDSCRAPPATEAVSTIEDVISGLTALNSKLKAGEAEDSEKKAAAQKDEQERRVAQKDEQETSGEEPVLTCECGARWAPTAKFCHSCGASRTQCEACATFLPPGTKFCYKCGVQQQDAEQGAREAGERVQTTTPAKSEVGLQDAERRALQARCEQLHEQRELQDVFAKVELRHETQTWTDHKEERHPNGAFVLGDA